GMRQLLYGIAAIERALPKLLIVPGIFADRERDFAAIHQEEGLRFGGDEVTRFVEHIVRRQQHFGLAEQDAASHQYGRAIGGALTGERLRRAYVSGDRGERQRGRLGGQTFQLLRGAFHEGGFLNQV